MNPKSLMVLFKYMNLYENFEKPLVKIANRIIAVSSVLKLDIIRQYSMSESKVVIIPVGIKVTNAEVPETRAKEKGEIVVFSGGRLMGGKGFKDIAKLFYYLDYFEPSKFKFIIYGDGPFKNELISIVRRFRMDKKIAFVSFIDKKSIHRFLLGGDVFIFMSKLKEGLPLSILDAMGAGLVVFSLRIGGVMDLIREGETGFILNDRNFKKTALFIIEKTKSREILKGIGDNERKNIHSKFTLEQISKRHIKLYRKVLTSFKN